MHAIDINLFIFKFNACLFHAYIQTNVQLLNMKWIIKNQILFPHGLKLYYKYVFCKTLTIKYCFRCRLYLFVVLLYYLIVSYPMNIYDAYISCLCVRYFIYEYTPERQYLLIYREDHLKRVSERVIVA